MLACFRGKTTSCWDSGLWFLCVLILMWVCIRIQEMVNGSSHLSWSAPLNSWSQCYVHTLPFFECQTSHTPHISSVASVLAGHVSIACISHSHQGEYGVVHQEKENFFVIIVNSSYMSFIRLKMSFRLMCKVSDWSICRMFCPCKTGKDR